MLIRTLILLGLVAVSGLWAPAWAVAPVRLFESPPVHPLELSPDGTLLYAVHTEEHRLAVFDLTAPNAPRLVAEIPVGLEPVTVRARGGRVWVVNHLSDSISIIDLGTLSVVRTLLVGDEPTDVVFAGQPARAFVCLSQEDRIRVYDADNPGSVLADIPLEGSDPRSLALSPDGSKVYVTLLESGNGTAVVPALDVAASGGSPPPNPPRNPLLPSAPKSGLIVKYNGAQWVDEIGRTWGFVLHFRPLDNDVIEIDAATRAVTRSFHGVGTSIFNVAVNPASGMLFVSAQEADNHIRFEPNAKGRFVRSLVTRVNPGTSAVSVGNLNTHVDLGHPAGSDAERALSLALPLDLAVAADGQKAYVAAFGSAKVGVLDAAGAVVSRIAVGNGPCGVALDPPRGALYVLNRIDRTISVVSTATESVLRTVSLGFDAVPADLRAGQRLFYDAVNSSAHGDLTCATCHLFAGMDNLAWDLGDPTGTMQPPPPGASPGVLGFHPMKGPLTTQSLKSLSGTEPLHWRGDRASLEAFDPAFVSLLGRAAALPLDDLQRFRDFIFAVRYSPNPNRSLDGSLPTSLLGGNPRNGEQLFRTGTLEGTRNCVECHALPLTTNRDIIPNSTLGRDSDLKVPQLRNLYEKTRFDNQALWSVRTFGYTADGTVDDILSFFDDGRFNFVNNAERLDVQAFLMALDTGTHAAVGAQWTMDGANEAAGLARVNTLVAAANTGGIGLIAKGRNGAGESRGWVYQGGGVWASDRVSEGGTTLTALLDLAGPGTEITFTAVVAGQQTRLGVDRDEDGYRDRDEIDGGSDPANPASNPTNVGVEEPAQTISMHLSPAAPNPAGAAGTRLSYGLDRTAPVELLVFDVQGRQVRTLVDRADHPAGEYTQLWDLRDDARRSVSSGVYFVRLRIGETTLARRITVIE